MAHTQAYLPGLTAAIALSLVIISCDQDCARENGLPEGARFEVTVTEDSPSCHTTFTAGDTFFVTAGQAYDVEGCPVSPGNWVPEFAQTDLDLGACEGNVGLGVICEVTFPGCTNAGSRIETWFYDIPEKRNQTVSTEFWMRLSSVCGAGCGATVPVRIKWL